MHFDQFAGNYKQVLDRSLAASGEDSAYFAEYKAHYLARTLREAPPAKVLDFGCGIGLLSGFLQKHLGPLRGKTIALLGLAFKPNTDDMREAPSRVIAYRLLAEGATVRAWDPVARPEDFTGIELSDTVLDAVRDADAAVIVTEWPELATLASPEVRDAMARPLIIDGRNLLDPEATQAAGFAYEGIGRPRHASPVAG